MLNIINRNVGRSAIECQFADNLQWLATCEIECKFRSIIFNHLTLKIGWNRPRDNRHRGIIANKKAPSTRDRERGGNLEVGLAAELGGDRLLRLGHALDAIAQGGLDATNVVDHMRDARGFQ